MAKEYPRMHIALGGENFGGLCYYVRPNAAGDIGFNFGAVAILGRNVCYDLSGRVPCLAQDRRF